MADLTFLEEDPEIPSQKYAVISFISPEKILKQKDIWMFQQFRRQYVVDTRIECWQNFCAFLSKKHNLGIDDVMKDFLEFKDIHEQKPEFSYSDSEKAWDDFLFKNEKKLHDEFSKVCDYQTNIRGFKIRRVGDNLKEMEQRAKKFVDMDKGKFMTALVEVGKWAPWDPNPAMMENVKSANEELNKLLESAEENRVQKDKLWAEEKDFQKKKIVEENNQRKEEAERLRQLENERA